MTTQALTCSRRLNSNEYVTALASRSDYSQIERVRNVEDREDGLFALLIVADFPSARRRRGTRREGLPDAADLSDTDAEH